MNQRSCGGIPETIARRPSMCALAVTSLEGLNRLFLAGLLDALLAGVQGAFLALGRLHHFLLRLGGYESNGQQETNTKRYDNTYQPAASA